jgi:hypothetical protein
MVGTGVDSEYMILIDREKVGTTKYAMKIQGSFASSMTYLDLALINIRRLSQVRVLSQYCSLDEVTDQVADNDF